MTNLNSKIVAGIISYQPEMDRFLDNILHLANQVEKIIIVDNASDNINSIEKALKSYQNTTLIKNNTNVGMAKALNQIMEQAELNGSEWVITMDQDSVVAKNMVEKFMEFADDPSVAIVCPFVIDKRRQYIRYEYKKPYEQVDMCITSGSMTRVDIWKKLGKFDDWLFIDLIDNDFCKRIKLYGYKIIRVNEVLLNQEFGKIERKSKAWTAFFVNLGGLFHNTNIQKLSYKKTVYPIRVYYTIRNILYLNKKYLNYGGIGYTNYHCKTYFGFHICFTLASFLRGKDKKQIGKSIIQGIKDGKAKEAMTIPLRIGSSFEDNKGEL